MPTPAWIESLRAKIGHDLIMTTGVCAIVFNDKKEILLQKRADNGRWALPGGILDPDERVADAAIREVIEETGIDVAIDRLSGVYSTKGTFTYANGDQINATMLAFVGHVVGGTLGGLDGESTEAAFFPTNALPENMTASHLKRIQDAADNPSQAVID